MTHRRGHVPIYTTLRPPEVGLLDRLVEQLEALRKTRTARGASRAGDDTPIRRAGTIRAMIRFALENPERFEAWLAREENAR